MNGYVVQTDEDDGGVIAAVWDGGLFFAALGVIVKARLFFHWGFTAAPDYLWLALSCGLLFLVALCLGSFREWLGSFRVCRAFVGATFACLVLAAHQYVMEPLPFIGVELVGWALVLCGVSAVSRRVERSTG